MNNKGSEMTQFGTGKFLNNDNENQYAKTPEERRMEIVINEMDLLYELSLEHRMIEDINRELLLDNHQDEKEQIELNKQLKKAKKLYNIYLKECIRKGLLPKYYE